VTIPVGTPGALEVTSTENPSLDSLPYVTVEDESESEVVLEATPIVKVVVGEVGEALKLESPP
jgi:hypothetical protein